jgi:hypothetical protein
VTPEAPHPDITQLTPAPGTDADTDAPKEVREPTVPTGPADAKPTPVAKDAPQTPGDVNAKAPEPVDKGEAAPDAPAATPAAPVAGGDGRPSGEQAIPPKELVDAGLADHPKDVVPKEDKPAEPATPPDPEASAAADKDKQLELDDEDGPFADAKGLDPSAGDEVAPPPEKPRPTHHIDPRIYIVSRELACRPAEALGVVLLVQTWPGEKAGELTWDELDQLAVVRGFGDNMRKALGQGLVRGGWLTHLEGKDAYKVATDPLLPTEDPAAAEA